SPNPETPDWFDINIDGLTGQEVNYTNWTHYDNDAAGSGGTGSGGTGSGGPVSNMGATANGLTDLSSFATSTPTSNAGTGSYNVYPLPVSTPDDGVRQVESSPEDAYSSPFGWHDINGVNGADFTDTRGNNVFAQEDINADNIGGARPSGGQSLDFDFPIDFTLDPTTYTAAATAQLFYTNNLLHDIHARYGFDAASGNFQVNNYGLGGIGNDQVMADAQDGITTDNANFSTPPDGFSGRMQMFLWDITPIQRDGDLDNQIIVHEFGHGVSNRLTGGAANSNALNALQSGGMGEGWGDFWALMFTQRPSDQQNGGYTLGTYVIGEPTTGAGIRAYPYSYDLVIDPHTYDDYNTIVNSPFGYDPHAAGEIWTSALWDMNWLLINKDGYDSDLYTGTGGNEKALSLVMEALKIQPANPSFLDGRDAILAADKLLYGGVDQYEIWQAFARRGMGFSADDGGSGNSTVVTAAFDVPSTPKGELTFDQANYSVGDTVTITLKDIDLAGTGGQDLVVRSSAGDIETVHLTEVRNGGIFIGSIISKNSETSGFTISNGLLEVPRSSGISVSYVDQNDGTGNSATVTDTATFFVFNDITRFDFSNSDGTPSTEGTTNSGTVDLWHLSTGRGFDLGHSSDDSFYFGAGEGANGGGSYVPNSNGTLTTSQIDLTNYAGPILLNFNTFLDVEDFFDSATVSVITSSGTTLIATNNGPSANLPDSTGGFQKITLDLSAFAGQKIRLAFTMQSDATIQREGWYVDDIAVTVPLATIEGTKYNDINGNGILDAGEGPLPNWTIFLDNNNDGMLDNDITTVPHTATVAIPDNGQVSSTLTIANVVGNLTDLNVTLSIDHTRDSDLSVFLVSPQGTRVQLFNNVGGVGQNFTSTTFDSQANTAIDLGAAPFTGTFSPQGTLSAFNSQDPNGVWTLEVHDNATGQTGTLKSWSLTTTTSQGTSVTDASTTPIPDNSQISSTLTVSNVIGPITDLNVNLSIADTRNSDFGVFLVSPNGTRVLLFNNVGGNTQNFVNTTLDDQANFSIDLGSSPFIGSFSPQGLLSTLNGENPNGVWTLEVHDNAVGNTGTLLNWSVTVTTVEGSAVTDANGHYSLTAPVGGTFNVREVPQTGWVQTSPAPTAGNPFPAQQVTVPFGGIVENVDFYNQFILPIITLPNGPAIYTENEPPVTIDSGARVTDANSANFANGTLTVTLTANATPDDRLSIRSQGFGFGQIGVSGNQVYFQGTSIGTFGGGVGSNPLVVTFNANATTAAVQALLRVVQFEAIGDDPSPQTRTVQIVITDGTDGASAPATKQIIVIAVNDPPVVTVSTDTLTYPEDTTVQPVDIFATVSDPDSSDFSGGYLKVSVIGNEGGPVQTTQRTYVANNAPVPLDYTLNPTNPTILSPLIVSGADGTLTDVNVTVNITHTDDPELTAYLISPTGTRVKLFSNVGASTFPGTSQDFTNTTFDDQASTPILSFQAFAPYAGSFRPEKELSPLNGENPNGTWNLEITDALGNIFDGKGSLITWSLGLTMTETSVNEKLAILNQGQGAGAIGLVGNRVTYSGTVIGIYTGGVGTTPLVIGFNANATQAAVQSLMQNVTLEIQGDSPILGQRLVEFVVDDGDGGTSLPADRLIDVVAVNDPPTLTLPSGQSMYVEGSLPIVLDTFATVSDLDSADFNGGVLTVDLGTTAKANDIIGIRSTGVVTGSINVSGTTTRTVRYGTTPIGTVTGGTGGVALTVTFNSAATPVAVQALVRAITFQAAGSNPNTSVRIAKFQVTDGDSGASDVVSKVITVQQINDPPVLTLSTTTNPPDPTLLSQVTYNANGLPVVLDSLATLTDPDTLVFNGGRLTVSLISGASGRDRLSLTNGGGVVLAGTNVSFNGIVVGRLTPGVGTAPLTVDFNASASKEAVQAVIRAVTFQIIGLDPTAGDRTASFQITDGSGGVSATKTRKIIVQVANQPPVNTVPSITIQTQEDVPVAVTGLSVTDPDASLLPMQVTLTVLHGTITVDTSVLGGLGISDVTGNGTNRVVLFADQFTINATLESLNGVIYQGNADYNGSDELTMLTSDLGNSGPGGVLTDSDSVFIDLQAMFDTATITPSASVTRNVKGLEVLLDPSIKSKLGDGQTDMDGAILSVNVAAGRNRSDRLRLMIEGSGAGQINTVTKKGVISLRLGTVVIGKVSGGENGRPLKIVFNDNATAADLQHVLRRITFRTAVSTTVFGFRTVTYDFTDALGLSADQATKQVKVVRTATEPL
ncbi:MAG: Protein of unknown function precursor containing a C-terminal secretion signal, partial [Planctomycetaceae bacterium]|nr:Protein of unknown function precursor containing a C-terminal secretion signal [Planctomycetaceae bacterium]